MQKLQAGKASATTSVLYLLFMHPLAHGARYKPTTTTTTSQPCPKKKPGFQAFLSHFL